MATAVDVGVMTVTADAQLSPILEQLDQLVEDTSVPRNIRRGAKDSKDRLSSNADAQDVRVAGALTILDELANDPNIPLHGRTLIWSIISQLESMRG